MDTNAAEASDGVGSAVRTGGDFAPRPFLRLTRTFVALGILLRLTAYIVDFPLWWDEALVAVNFLRRGYFDLLRPLDGGQVAPLLFLWAELSVVKLLGFNEWSLRLVPLLCGIASVPLFRSMAERVAPGRASLVASAIFAVSVHPIRHSADLKPYSADLLMALILQWLAFRWLGETDQSRRLWTLAGFAPIALLSSHTSILIAGGLCIALLGSVWRTRRPSVWFAYTAYGVTVCLAYAVSYVLVAKGQSSSAAPGMRVMWEKSFPPLNSGLGLLKWFWTVHSGDMLAYPCGGERGASSLSLLLAVLGVVGLINLRRWSVLNVLLIPLGMAILAATFRLYPYGGPAPHGSAARVMQYAAPGLCLLIGVGANWSLDRLVSIQFQRRVLRSGLVALVVVGLVTVGARFRQPYRAYHAEASRQFARSFWPEMSRDAEVLDLRWDVPVGRWDSIHLGTAVMLCDEAIYSPARRRGGPNWSALSVNRPLRCVLGVATERDQPALDKWLTTMREHYFLRWHRSITIETAEAGPGRVSNPERYEVFEFVPR